MPTGIPIPDVRDQLFAAAERVLVGAGADALTSRAVTDEAGVSKGILHRHFADFDTFLASLALARIELLDRLSAELRASAGSGDVHDNVVAALSAVLVPESLAIVSLVVSRRELLLRLRLMTPTGVPLLTQAANMIAGYLTAERGLGRIPLETEVDGLAVIVVGGAYLLAAGRDAAPPDPDEFRNLVMTAIATVVPAPSDRVAQT